MLGPKELSRVQESSTSGRGRRTGHDCSRDGVLGGQRRQGRRRLSPDRQAGRRAAPSRSPRSGSRPTSSSRRAGHQLQWLQREPHRSGSWPPLVYSGDGANSVVNPQESLYSSLKWSDGDKVITIVLKPWKWSDGTPITSRDFTFVYQPAQGELQRLVRLRPGPVPRRRAQASRRRTPARSSST